MISQMLRDSAKRFNQAADLVCLEYSQAIAADGICSPSDRRIFKNLILAKLESSDLAALCAA